MRDLNRQQTTAQVFVSARDDAPPPPLLIVIDEPSIRARFEACMREEGVVNFERTSLGRYNNMVLEWTWLGWRNAVRSGAAS